MKLAVTCPMKCFTYFIGVAILITLLAVSSPALAYDWATCPLNGHRYILVDSESWLGAKAQAVALGGHLATIRSNAENDWIRQFAFDTKASCYRLWIGANKPLGSQQWLWSSGEQMIYTNWVSWMNPSDWENQAAYMFVRYWDVQDEEIARWGPENYGGIPGNPVYTTGIVEVGSIPESSSLLVLGTGMLGLIGWRKARCLCKPIL